MEKDQTPSINDLYAEIKELRGEIQKLMLLVQEQSKTTTRMDSHISFVEDTFEIVRSPLYIMCDKITGMFGNNYAALEDQRKRITE